MKQLLNTLFVTSEDIYLSVEGNVINLRVVKSPSSYFVGIS